MSNSNDNTIDTASTLNLSNENYIDECKFITNENKYNFISNEESDAVDNVQINNNLKAPENEQNNVLPKIKKKSYLSKSLSNESFHMTDNKDQNQKLLKHDNNTTFGDLEPKLNFVNSKLNKLNKKNLFFVDFFDFSLFNLMKENLINKKVSIENLNDCYQNFIMPKINSFSCINLNSTSLTLHKRQKSKSSNSSNSSNSSLISGNSKSIIKSNSCESIFDRFNYSNAFSYDKTLNSNNKKNLDIGCSFSTNDHFYDKSFDVSSKRLDSYLLDKIKVYNKSTDNYNNNYSDINQSKSDLGFFCNKYKNDQISENKNNSFLLFKKKELKPIDHLNNSNNDGLNNLMLDKPMKSRKSYTLNIPGQTSSKTSPDGKISKTDIGSKLIIAMVGLPARGKSYITNKLCRYLNWLQHDCCIFNVGNTRRNDMMYSDNNDYKDFYDFDDSSKAKLLRRHGASFFDSKNECSNALREKWAFETLDKLLDYLIKGFGSVGIFDATNSTKLRRLKILQKIQEKSNGELKVLFLESICSNPVIIESNIRLKLSGPDYKNMDSKLALNDFLGRLNNYELIYESIDKSEEEIPNFQYVKMIDVGKKLVSYNIQGFLASQAVYYLLNFKLCERQIWITRHGESYDNLTGIIGGDSCLTKRGHRFSKSLARFMNFQNQKFRKEQLKRFSRRLKLNHKSIFGSIENMNLLDQVPKEPNFCVWTSMLTRSIETASYFDEKLYHIKNIRMLNELSGGQFEGMTHHDMKTNYPKEFEARSKNKMNYRFPGVGGESYLDVLTRLTPLIIEIERTTDHLLIVSHRVVSRILLAYFLNLKTSSIKDLDVPLHTLYCLDLKPYGTDYKMFQYNTKLDWFFRVELDQKNYNMIPMTSKID